MNRKSTPNEGNNVINPLTGRSYLPICNPDSDLPEYLQLEIRLAEMDARRNGNTRTLDNSVKAFKSIVKRMRENGDDPEAINCPAELNFAYFGPTMTHEQRISLQRDLSELISNLGHIYKSLYKKESGI